MRMLYAVLLLLISCAKPISKPIATSPAPQSGKIEKSSPSADRAVNASIVPTEDESVSPPSKVSGAALHCSVTKELSQKDTVVGCRFDDADGKRVPAAQLADRAVFSFVPPFDPSVTVKMHELRPETDTGYDVAYVFSAPTREQAEAAALLTQVLVSFEGLRVDLPPVVSAVVKDILVMGAEILKGLAQVANVIAGEIQRANDIEKANALATRD